MTRYTSACRVDGIAAQESTEHWMWPNMARLLILVSLVYGLADDRPVLSKSLVSCAVPTRLTELFDRNGTLASALALHDRWLAHAPTAPWAQTQRRRMAARRVPSRGARAGPTPKAKRPTRPKVPWAELDGPGVLLRQWRGLSAMPILKLCPAARLAAFGTRGMEAKWFCAPDDALARDDCVVVSVG